MKMRNRLYVLMAFVSFCTILSCKKDKQPQQQTAPAVQSLENGLLSFSIGGELIEATIDTSKNTIIAVVPNSADMHNLTATFTLAGQVNAAVNSTAVKSGFVYDFSKPVSLTVTSANKRRSTTFTIIVEPELEYIGVAGNVVAAKSLNKSYNFYIDQWDGSPFQSINCGPTVTTMAIKWADPTFTKTPVDARHQLQPKGGWWYTGDVQTYLTDDGINYAVDSLSDFNSLVKQSIDNNNLVILCLDMYYVPQDLVSYQHIQKFYEANTTGWGHFLLVKGYKETDMHTFYLEIYDPYSDGARYFGLDEGKLKGKDRYYISDDIKLATNIWWPYAIIVAAKGQKVPGSTHLQINGIGAQTHIPPARGR